MCKCKCVIIEQCMSANMQRNNDRMSDMIHLFAHTSIDAYMHTVPHPDMQFHSGKHAPTHREETATMSCVCLGHGQCGKM